MSEEQQLAAIGRTVEEYGSCKKTLAALQSEAARMARDISYAGQNLAQLSQTPSLSNGTVMNAINQITSFPSLDSVHSTAMEIKTTWERKESLRAQLRNMDIDPKD